MTIDMNEPEQAKLYAERIYRDFCESDDDESILGEAWHTYQDSNGLIKVGSPTDVLVASAIQYAIEQYLIIKYDEEFDKNVQALKTLASLSSQEISILLGISSKANKERLSELLKCLNQG